MKMDMALRYGLSIGLLGAVWTYLCPLIGIPAWPTFIAWALFYAAGADEAAIWKVITPGLTGMVVGFIAIYFMPYFHGSVYYIPLAIIPIALVLCMLSVIKYWVYIPAAFAGCATFFGVGILYQAALPFTVGGLFLGILSLKLALLGVKTTKETVEDVKA